jgi:hypothetical protein
MPLIEDEDDSTWDDEDDTWEWDGDTLDEDDDLPGEFDDHEQPFPLSPLRGYGHGV